MAPKKRSGKVTSVMKTKKVVEETVQVVVSPTKGEGDDERVEILSSSTKENDKVEVISSSKCEQQQKPQEGQKEQQDDDETQPAEEPEVTPALPKPRVEEPRKKDENIEKSKKRKAKATQEVKEGEKKKVEASKEEGKKKRRKRGGEGYKRYVFKVMKQVHPDMGMSSKAMTILNNYMSDMFERIAVEAKNLSKCTGKRTLSSGEIQGAVKLVLPGELGKHAIAEGSKAVSNYVLNISGGSKSKRKT